MSGAGICCQHPLSHEVGEPFDRIVALGYYDGPTSGVARCSHCGVAFRFEMLAWDTVQDVRIFCLARLPEGSFEALVAACPLSHPPEWPVWVPRWEFSSEEEQEAADQAVQTVLHQAQSAQFVVACADGFGEIAAVRELGSGEFPNVDAWLAGCGPQPVGDWFAFMGLEV